MHAIAGSNPQIQTRGVNFFTDHLSPCSHRVHTNPAIDETSGQLLYVVHCVIFPHSRHHRRLRSLNLK